MLSDLPFRLRAIFRRRSVEQGKNDELRFYIEHEIHSVSTPFCWEFSADLLCRWRPRAFTARFRAR
jgi:hypothetical protein